MRVRIEPEQLSFMLSRKSYCNMVPARCTYRYPEAYLIPLHSDGPRQHILTISYPRLGLYITYAFSFPSQPNCLTSFLFITHLVAATLSP